MMRVRFVIDDDATLENPSGSPLPGPESEYVGNEIFELVNPSDDPVTGLRRAVSYEEYCKVYGNPDRHVVLGAIVEVCCPHCKTWKAGPSLWNIDFMDTDTEANCVGREYLDSEIDKIPGYLREVARDLFHDAQPATRAAESRA